MANHSPRYFPDGDLPSASVLPTSSTEPTSGVKPARSTDNEDIPKQRTRHETQIINNLGISGNARVVNVGGDYITNNSDALGAEAYAVLKSIEQRLKVVHDVILDGKVDGWLSAPDISQNFNAALRKRQAGTGGWFLDGAQFAQWKENSNVVLCIYGAPGCGKTVLCASVIEAVKDLCKTRLSGWAYFFFDSRNANKGLQLYENFLRSVLSQLSSRCGGTPGAVLAMYQVHGSGKEQPSVKDLEETLRKVLGAFDDVYIMVDSLDECGDRNELLKWIEALAKWGSTRWHLLTTSRSEPDITSHLERIHNIRIVQLTGKALDKDISIFLDERLSLIIRWTKPIRVLIKTTLVDGADGMFRWVAMQMDSLEHCLNVRAVRAKLNTLPRDLEETYEQILAGSPHYHDLLHMLHWLAFSTRALRLEEIAEVASVDFEAAGGPCYDPDLKYANSRIALTVCSGLITETDGFVKLAHFSVKEYLISDRIKTGTAAHFAINLHLSHSVIAQTCVAYLLIFSHRASGHYPLHLYAADNVAEHLRLMEDNGCAALRELLLKLFIPTPRYEYALVNWVQMHNFDKNGWAEKEDAPPLFYASFLGLRDVVQRLLENGVDVNEQAINHATALQAAAANGHTETVKLLLEHGANVNIQQEYVGSALLQAAGGGHVDIAKILLEYGADIDLPGGPDEVFGTAFQVAEENGDTDMVQLLLEHGADSNAATLQGAAANGRTETVKRLLGLGADVNTRCEKYGTALQAAAANGRTETAKFLLKRGADTNVSEMEHSPPLQVAASGGYTGIVEILLEHGVDIQQGEYSHGTALQAAAVNGHTETAKFLLERGADANVSTTECRPALEVAASGGHTGIVEMLLKHGVDIEQDEDWTGTALQAAAASGRTRTVEFLLERGADANSHRGRFGSPLTVAASGGHTGIVEMLLEHGVDIEQGKRRHGTALQAAVANEHTETVTLLLERGADANVWWMGLGPPLQVAAAGGYAGIVEILLEHGVDIEQGEDSHGTALQVAVANGHTKITKFLLERGADANIQRGRFGSPLKVAASGGHTGIVEMLLEHGVDIEQDKHWHGTALQAAAANGHTETAKFLLERGANANAKVSGMACAPPLQGAASGGHTSTVKMLLEHGVGIDRGKRWHAGTALQAAAANGHTETAKFLLECGADANIRGWKYGTALLAAAYGGHTETAKLLLEGGADINLRSEMCSMPSIRYRRPPIMTALQVAVARGKTETEQLLLQYSMPGRD